MGGALGVSQTAGRGEQYEESVSGAESMRLGDEEMDAVRFDRLSELPAGLFQTGHPLYFPDAPSIAAELGLRFWPCWTLDKESGDCRAGEWWPDEPDGLREAIPVLAIL